MGSHNISQNKSASEPGPTTTLNPISTILAQLFGQDVRVQDGGYQVVAPGEGLGNAQREGSLVPNPLSGAAFTAENFAPLADLFNAQNIGAPGVPGLMDDILGGAQQGQDFFRDVLFPNAAEGAETGFLTNTDELASRATRTAQGNVAEQYAGIGQGFSSDFLSQMGQTEADIRAQLGFQAAESAADRRADILPLASTLPGQQSQAASGSAISLLNLGEQLIMDATPGGRAATIMQMLAGLQPTSAIPRGNIQRSTGFGNAGAGGPGA